MARRKQAAKNKNQEAAVEAAPELSVREQEAQARLDKIARHRNRANPEGVEAGIAAESESPE